VCFACAVAGRLDGLGLIRSGVGTGAFAAGAFAAGAFAAVAFTTVAFAAGGRTGAEVGGFVARPPVNRTEGFASALAGGAWGAGTGGRTGGAARCGPGNPVERAG
jgi:hypothetical protein